MKDGSVLKEALTFYGYRYTIRVFLPIAHARSARPNTDVCASRPTYGHRAVPSIQALVGGEGVSLFDSTVDGLAHKFIY